MGVLDDIRYETSLDLSNATLVLDFLAPSVADRWVSVYGDWERIRDTARTLYANFNSLGSASPLQAIQMAYNVLDTAWKWVYGQAGKKSFENLERRAKTRGEFVKKYFGLPAMGDASVRRPIWSQVLTSSKNPSPAKLAMQLGVKQSPGEHLAQWDPYYVFHVSRVGRRQTINPTWSTPPYDSPADQPSLWQGGVSYEKPSLLGGYVPPLPLLAELLGDAPAFLDRPPGTPAIPGKYADDYWGNAPGGGAVDADPPRGDMGLDWSPLDRAVFARGYAPPPGYQWLFSWGTYPYLSWFGTVGLGDDRLDFCAEAAALSAAIHGFTPLHAAMDAREVAQCYRHFLATSGLRKLPVAPKSQVQSGIVYLDREELLPFSNTPNLPVPVSGGFASIDMLNSIELSFRSFFRIRRAALYQFDFTEPAFKTAALSSPDPDLRAVAAGKPPPDYAKWDARDALGDGWIDLPAQETVEEDDGPSIKPGLGGGTGNLKGTAPVSSGGGDDGGGLALGLALGAGALVGGGLLARNVLKKRRRR